jgi:MinD-like ATPase involved in chromosome partitioning or flagellar assembly
MTILVGATIPGLLTGLEACLGGSQDIDLQRSGDAVLQVVNDETEGRRLRAVIVDDTVRAAPGDSDVYTTMWNIVMDIGTVGLSSALVLVMRADTPSYIQESLRAEVRKAGGIFLSISGTVRSPEDPAAQAVVRSILQYLHLERTDRRVMLTAGCSTGGGVGKSVTMNNLALYLGGLRGLRVLVAEFDISQGSVMGFFKVLPEEAESLTSLPDECPRMTGSYPVEHVVRRIVRHPSGVDLLLAGQGMRDMRDMEPRHMLGLARTLLELPYDVIVLDIGTELKHNPVVLRLFQEGLQPVVVFQAGRKEREGGRAVLDVLGQIGTARGGTALEHAMVTFIAPERDHVMNIRDVRTDVLRQYPMVTDLGILPRDTALVSAVAERREFTTIFEVNPRAPYVQAVRAMGLTWAATVGIAEEQFRQDDPLARRRWWQGRGRSATPGRVIREGGAA